ncbi:MAG TPA: septum formation initiator family protein [Propionibacteriaceae bacterium]|nr:septum formation initiator family protein [Propionibacteriaceae bacterium]
MADGRSTPRKGTAPGRGTSSRPGQHRDRAGRRPSATAPQETPAQAPTGKGPRLAPGLGVTQRVVAFVVVVAILALSYVSSLRIYFDQEQQMASSREQIARDQAAVDRLSDEIARWQDPAYVKAQARDRLGWVLPGEIGYRVVGPDGKVVGGQVGTIEGRDEPEKQTWYEKLQGSIQTADQPAPVPSTPTPEKTVTVPSPTTTSTKR